MSRPQKTVSRPRRQAFFGPMAPVINNALLLSAGLAAIGTFYVSVLAAAHTVAADSGGGREQIGRITLWVCALFLAQGLVPIVRFGVRDLPRLVIGSFRINVRDVLLFVLLLAASALLFL